MSDATSAYGLWSLVIINSLVFIIFAFSFARPQSSVDWRSFGAFSAFLAAARRGRRVLTPVLPATACRSFLDVS